MLTSLCRRAIGLAAATAVAAALTVGCTAAPGAPQADVLASTHTSGDDAPAATPPATVLEPDTATPTVPAPTVPGAAVTTSSTTSTTVAPAAPTEPDDPDTAVVGDDEPAPPADPAPLDEAATPTPDVAAPTLETQAAALAAPPVDLHAVAALLQAQADERVVLDAGHTDLIEVTVDGGRLVIQVKDDTKGGGAVFRQPSNVQARVKDSARIQVPGDPAFSFLGAAGSDLWMLPQVQDPTLLWPGWSTERMSPGQVQGDHVTLRLATVDGPGSFALFTTNQFGVPNVIFDNDGTAPNSTVIPIHTHAHSSWAFGAPGVYRLTFEVSATLANGTAVSTPVTYVYLVGDATAPMQWEDTPNPATTVPPSSSGPAANAGTSSGAGTGSANAAGPGSASASGGSTTGPSASNASGSRSGAGSTGTASAGAGSLARTGTSPLSMVLLGLGLLIVGLGATRFALRWGR